METYNNYVIGIPVENNNKPSAPSKDLIEYDLNMNYDSNVNYDSNMNDNTRTVYNTICDPPNLLTNDNLYKKKYCNGCKRECLSENNNKLCLECEKQSKKCKYCECCTIQ